MRARGGPLRRIISVGGGPVKVARVAANVAATARSQSRWAVVAKRVGACTEGLTRRRPMPGNAPRRRRGRQHRRTARDPRRAVSRSSSGAARNRDNNTVSGIGRAIVDDASARVRIGVDEPCARGEPHANLKIPWPAWRRRSAFAEASRRRTSAGSRLGQHAGRRQLVDHARDPQHRIVPDTRRKAALDCRLGEKSSSPRTAVASVSSWRDSRAASDSAPGELAQGSPSRRDSARRRPFFSATQDTAL